MFIDALAIRGGFREEVRETDQKLLAIFETRGLLMLIRYSRTDKCERRDQHPHP